MTQKIEIVGETVRLARPLLRPGVMAAAAVAAVQGAGAQGVREQEREQAAVPVRALGLVVALVATRRRGMVRPHLARHRFRHRPRPQARPPIQM